MVLVLELIARSSLLRQESRGAHFRKDFPETDNQQWLNNTILQKSREGITVTAEPVVMSIFKLRIEEK
jgi:succinate dehydrogenase/fumarate reductase flavoprotein subunit